MNYDLPYSGADLNDEVNRLVEELDRRQMFPEIFDFSRDQAVIGVETSMTERQLSDLVSSIFAGVDFVVYPSDWVEYDFEIALYV